MKNHILKILILLLFFTPFLFVQGETCKEYDDTGNLIDCPAQTDEWGVPNDYGKEEDPAEPVPEGGGSQPAPEAGSGLYIMTNPATDETFTTAVLNGEAGTTNNLEITGYFRYTKAEIAPIFCNDIYGSNMVATGDVKLGTVNRSAFSYEIKNLEPDTTYYYCAIVSDRNNIEYGGEEIVQSFHTSPYDTTVKTNPATSISYTGATLNGTVSALSTVTTYFEYRQTPTVGSTSNWQKITGSQKTHTLGDKSNIYEKVSYEIEGLSSSSRYQFRLIAETNSGTGARIETKKTTGSTISFTTSTLQRTAIRTNSATSITQNSATLNGSFTARESVMTYFQYRKSGNDGNEINWTRAGTKRFGSTNFEVRKEKVSFGISNLEKSTRYEFRMVGETDSGTFYGSTLSFQTVGDGSGGGGTTPTTCEEPQHYDYNQSKCVDPAADLTAGGVSPSLSTAGVPTSYYATISNIGRAKAEGINNTIYNIIQWDDDADHATVTSTTQKESSGSIEPNGFITVSFSRTMTAGTQYARVCADNNEAFWSTVVESNEDNNCGPWTTIRVKEPAPVCDGGQVVNPTTNTCEEPPTLCDAPQEYNFSAGRCTDPAPDLTVDSVYPNSAYKEVSQVYSAVVRNIGIRDAGDAQATISHIFQFDNDTDHNQILFAQQVTTVGAMKPGDYSLISIPYTFASGPQYMRACADKANTADVAGIINEYNEANNCGPWTRINVTDPNEYDPGTNPDYCTMYPDDPACTDTPPGEYCVTYPDDPLCTNTPPGRYCVLYPEDPLCSEIPPGQYCIDNPDDFICLDMPPGEYCTTYPDDPVCTNGTNPPGPVDNGRTNPGTWSSRNGGESGTWGTNFASGEWSSDDGCDGGTGTVNWNSNGDGTGTWNSDTCSGTWTTTYGDPNNGPSSGSWTNLTLGATATPPWDAIVRYHEGIETVFARQIVNRSLLKNVYGYIAGTSLQDFAWTLSHIWAQRFGYVSPTRREVRVVYPDRAAYQIQLEGNRITVYEYFDYKIVDIREVTTNFKEIADYEYYFQK